MSQIPVIEESAAKEAANKLHKLRDTINAVIFGQEELIELVITGMLARGHLLLEGLPGLGKTEIVKSFGKAVDMKINRVQFTPDLLPGDITGNPILQEHEGKRTFVFQPGPLFANLLLADEINRASPKTQSALLEAMQEHRVTVLGETHPLPNPFFVFATQNPIELEGTYPLPEAQLDRFLFKLDVHKSSPQVIEQIIRHRRLGSEPEVPQVMSGLELRELSTLADQIYLPEVVTRYIARLVHASHHGNSEAAKDVRFGASPRAAIGLAAAARAKALIAGRINASLEDIRSVARPILQHRIILDYQARLENKTGATVVEALLDEVPSEEKDLPSSLASAKI